MPDRLYLSLWIRGFDESNMLGHFERMLRTFPFSRLRPGIATLRIYAIEDAEPPLLEQAFTPGTGVEAVLAAAREFQNADCLYIVDGWWELWQFERDWKLAPAAVSLCCFGPLFENEVGDHLRIESGSEEHFLPRAEVAQSARAMQSNLKGLLRLARELEAALPVEERRLWSESGENLGERLDSALEDDCRA